MSGWRRPGAAAFPVGKPPDVVLCEVYQEPFCDDQYRTAVGDLPQPSSDRSAMTRSCCSGWRRSLLRGVFGGSSFGEEGQPSSAGESALMPDHLGSHGFLVTTFRGDPSVILRVYTRSV